MENSPFIKCSKCGLETEYTYQDAFFDEIDVVNGDMVFHNECSE